MTADDMLRSNVRARELAEECISLIEQVFQDSATEINADRFWQTLIAWLVIRHPSIPAECDRPSGAMTDDEARQFGHKQIPFGEFAGQRIDDVPLDRLCWYADQRFTDELRRYLKSPRIKTEIDA